MKRLIFKIFTISVLLLSNNILKAGVSISSFMIQDHFLIGGGLNTVAGVATPFTANFAISKAGNQYSEAHVTLILSDANTETVLSSEIIHYPGDWGSSFSWESTISGTLPAGKTTGRIYLRVIPYDLGSAGGPISSVISYQINVSQPGNGGTNPPPPNNPYPGSVIINSWITTKKNEHALGAEGTIIYSNGFGNIESQAFRAYTSPINGAVPIYRFKGGKDPNNDNLYSPSPNADSFWTIFPGVSFYAYDKQVAGTVPVYCYTDSNGRNHYFSIRNETDPYWHRQYIAFYAFPLN